MGSGRDEQVSGGTPMDIIPGAVPGPTPGTAAAPAANTIPCRERSESETENHFYNQLYGDYYISSGHHPDLLFRPAFPNSLDNIVTHNLVYLQEEINGNTPQPSTSETPQFVASSLSPDVTYEVETVWESGNVLHSRKLVCDKHPGHTQFVPVHEFNEQHLPDEYHDKPVVDLIRCLYYLTVRLTVAKVSPSRPDPPYPPVPRYNVTGSGCSITGTGHVSDALESTEEGKSCPCGECRLSSTPKIRWGKIYIHTAAHIVHDDLEATSTTCYFHYDNDSDDLEKVTKITGMERVEINKKEDRCWMFCYSHDMSLVRELQKKAANYQHLQKEVRDKYYVNWFNVSDIKHKLTAIVSHPHGCGKYVSVGEFVDRHHMEDDHDWTQYTYTTPTCPGCSGAPVFILGKIGKFDYHHHSGTVISTGLNRSTYGLF